MARPWSVEMSVGPAVLATPTLSVKLVPPAIGPSHLARPRLHALLHDITRKRLSVVVAGPGFGKSTLLASWAAESNAAWYSLGREDAQVPTLACGIIDALRLRVPVLLPELSAFSTSGGAQGANEDEGIGRATRLRSSWRRRSKRTCPGSRYWCWTTSMRWGTRRWPAN